MIKQQKTKTLVTKNNNNSANCIAPNLIYGCFGGCVNTYCYMSRYNGTRVFVNTNVDDIFNSVVKWEESFTKVPDQQDPIYTMVDIACNTDLLRRPSLSTTQNLLCPRMVIRVGHNCIPLFNYM